MSEYNSIAPALKCLHADNFTTYFKSHAFHFNVQGNTFAQDHGLLEEIYSFLWEQHDTLGEQIRQLNLPTSISMSDMLKTTEISEASGVTSNSVNMFESILKDFNILMANAQWVYDKAESSNMGGLSTLVGDYLKDLSKLRWKVRATLGKSMP